MTDKQIIIDGVDVSGCKDRYLGWDNSTCQNTGNSCPDLKCENNHNCYFKQLARAKQENKKLEKIINKLAERFCNDYLETFKENERLKSELQAKELELIMAKADLCRGCQYKNDYKAKEQECEELKGRLKYIINENKVLKDCATDEDIDIVALTNYISTLEFSKDQLKAENEHLLEKEEEARHYLEEAEKFKNCLAEIKEVLQFYNNTTIGTYKGNGIFEFEVSNDNILGRKLIYCYDTNPAKKALQKISECEVEND